MTASARSGLSCLSVCVYAAAWVVWGGFIALLHLYPPGRGLAWGDGLWAHVAAWGSLAVMVGGVGWAVPVPAPLGSGMGLLPLPDPLIQGITEIAFVAFPLVWGAVWLAGGWGVGWCWCFLLGLLPIHVARAAVLRRSAQRVLAAAAAHSEELRAGVAAGQAQDGGRPWYMRPPYLGLWTGVVVTRKYRHAVSVPVPETDACGGAHSIAMDVWTPGQGDGAPLAGRPVLFFIHGGAWVAGNHTRNASLAFLRRMAKAGWVVVSCSYQKNKWPVHILDCATGLQWTARHIAEYGGDASRGIVLSGASAGGHIAALLAAVAATGPGGATPSALQQVRALLAEVAVKAVLLWYPAVDPKDDDGEGVGTPWGEQFYSFFFRTCVGGANAQGDEWWDTVQPAAQLRAGRCRQYPPTLILHGTHDSVVPLAHSRRFFERLQALRAHPRDLFLPLPYARHSFELCPSRVHSAALDVAAGWAGLFAE